MSETRFLRRPSPDGAAGSAPWSMPPTTTMDLDSSGTPRCGSDVAAPAALLAGSTLRACPFCGGEAAVEPDPWLDGSVRIACGNDACRVKPRTEYLLACYADELREAWNARRPAAAPRS